MMPLQVAVTDEACQPPTASAAGTEAPERKRKRKRKSASEVSVSLLARM